MCDMYCSVCYERNTSVMDVLDYNFRYGTQVVRCKMTATELLYSSVQEVHREQSLEEVYADAR